MDPIVTAAAVTAGSQFLTGAMGKRGSYSSGSQVRQQHRLATQASKTYRADTAANQLAEWRGKMRAVKDSGLHRLAALGIAPSSGAGYQGAAAPQQVIPGQSDTGSAIESGISTALNLQQAKTGRAHSQAMATLQVEEQTLRNDWLRTQIQASRLKTAGAVMNSQQDRIHSDYGFHVGESPPPEVTGQNTGIIAPGGFGIPVTPDRTTADAVSDQYGDVVEWVYGGARAIEDVFNAAAPTVQTKVIKLLKESDARGKAMSKRRQTRKYDSRVYTPRRQTRGY